MFAELWNVSRRFLFLALIGLMLFVLAIAGQDRSREGAQPAANAVARTNGGYEIEALRALKPEKAGRRPASVARTLDIEPVLPGGE